ncbi:hemagglutinin repeat-containing protein [Desulfomicrobium baculatum]|uniref:Filamentous hemagglutinin family outer membrane protein n=1 Tax=Desulfomicrobium baculatum (strain DSM 4028 / VKM B-1378 / X) TaxID=525897 RepID=C7LTZ8_DESBD|nr:hemagglutinin repeat-containing protein [Desulfomicrobium baculatum]ACU89621.1 filamentous hemagglutinin family outer membrane protein [Desulfomicrobium baculatum DSM 4028]
MNHAIQRIICLTLAFLLVFNPMLATAGGIVVDSTAPSANQPGLSAAPNGVPMVDIAKPNSKGLSHNKYDHFNVGESGVIMNNSRKVGLTQLGGVVTNNPKLGKGPEARVILNEVTGSSRSRLEGYTEIFGYPADYILANPNGITVNGGGFINTPRATLTTGKPRFDEFGDLSALDVRQGDVLVDGLGLNVSNLDAFDIISRTARINADVHAVKLGISTGYGSHDVATGQFYDLPSDGSAAPTVGLDSTALGGMYAERIILVGNEKGVGVNLEGITHATDELVLTADGKIRIKGSVSSDNGVRVASTADNVEISGLLAAAKVADVTAAQTVSLQSGTGAKAFLYAEDVRLATESLRINDARVEAGKSLAVATRADVTNEGVLFSGGEAVLNVAGTVRNSGQMQAKDSLAVNSAAVENSGRVLSIGAVRIHSAGDVVNTGEVLSEKSTTIQTTANISNTGTIRTEGQAIISAGSLSNEGGSILAKDVMTLDAARHIANTGTIGADRDAIISAGSLGNEGGSILAQGDLDVVVTGDLSNSGMIYSGASSRIGAENLRNDPAGQVLALGSLSLDLGADLENLGVLNAGESLRVRSGGSLFNRGASILAQTGMELVAQGDIRNSGSIQSGGTGLFRSDGMLLNEGKILSVGEAVFEISNDLENTGILHSGGGSYDLGGKLLNSGEILSSGDLGLFLAGDLFNSGKIAGDADVAFDIEGSLENAAGGLMLASAEALFDVSGDLRNSGRMESTGRGLLGVGGGLFNTDGDILSQTALEFDVLGSLENTGVMHSGDILTLTSSSLDNSGQILAQGDSVFSVLGDLINTNFLFSGGKATFSVSGMLHNLRGQILSLGDMVLEGLEAGSRMLELKNDSGTIETLEGGMSIRAKVVRNSNLDFRLTPGTEVVSRKGGIYSYYTGSKWEQAEALYRSLLDASVALDKYGKSISIDPKISHFEYNNLKKQELSVPFKRNSMIIIPYEISVLGLDSSRKTFLRAELDAAILKTEKRIAEFGGTSSEISSVNRVKNEVNSKNAYIAVQAYRYRKDVSAYVDTIRKDSVVGVGSGGTIAAAANLIIDGESFANFLSNISTSAGDIHIISDIFANSGEAIYETHTVDWATGHPNNHSSPWLAVESYGREIFKTPVDYAYGTISAGGNVFISADHVNNGILENTGVASSNTGKVSYPGSIGPQGGVIAPPRPEDLAHNIDDIGDIIGELPKDGLFSVNKAPGHRYLVETNPALTSMALFYGSDYFLSRTGIDLSKTHQQLLGDAFYETRLVREQIFALTGRRFLSDSVSGDSEQMLVLMDNAVAAREDLNLSVGVALSADQVSALSSDIVWLETRVVDGHEVLVPVVYLCRSSLDTIARGGSVIVGSDVEIRTTGDTANSGVIKASGDLAINAKNIFNTFGTIQGDTVTLAAADSIFNTSGLIKGRDVSLDAGQDIISGTAKTTFAAGGKVRSSFVSSTSETVGQRGSIEATGDLSMRAGRDIGIVGSDVKAGGDATLSAGRNVAIVAQELESHSSSKTGTSKSSFNTLTSKASTVEVGGSVNISAGQDVAVHGSHVSAGADVNLEAGRDVSITAATDGYDYYFKQKSKGGFFGGSSSEMHTGKVTTNVASVITAGGDVNVVAGKGGAGDLAIVGSKVRSGVDMSLKAEDGILVSSAQESESMISASSRSTLFSGKSKASGDARVTQVGSEIVAGNDLKAEAKNVAVSASQIHANHDVDIKSVESDLIVSGAQNTVSAFRYEKKSGWNLSAPLEIPLAILVGGGVEFYSSKMKEGKNTASSNFGSLITAGNNVDLESARDAVVIGSTVAAGNDVNIKAVRDTNLIPGLTAQTSERRTKEKSIGFTALSISENEIKGFAGVTKKETGSKFTGDYNAGSVVSAGNDVKIEAGNNVNQFSSGIEAGRDVTLKSGNDINVDANKDVEHMEQYARQIQVGVTASARQSVTTAARTLADTPKNMVSGEGSDAAKGITAASSILRGVSAAQQLTNVSASASITAGASVSQSSSSMDAADAVSSSIRAGRDVELDADRDVSIAGAAVQAEEDVSIQAGRDVEIKSATNNFSAGSDSFTASAGVGLGASYSAKGGAAAGIRVQAEAAGSKNTSRAQIHTNSAVAAGETLSVKSGADTTVAGANLEGKKVAMDVGGDLVVKSEQDKRVAAGSNWNAGGSATLGYGFSADAHVGMGKSKADSAWVNKQTSIIGQEKVDIRTEKNTHVEGAVIAAENGNLKLDTGTLTYRDLEDHDKSKNFQVSLAGSYSSSGGDQKDANGSSSSASGTIDAGYSSGDRRQINRATIGDGEIIIRLDPSKGLEGLNRDLEKAREITRDDAVKVQVYVDSEALLELIDLIEKALEDPKTNEEAVKLLAELVSKGVITKKDADALLFKRSFTKAELKVAEEELSRMVKMNDPHQLAAYVDSLSPQERAAVAAVSMEKGRSQQEYELGLMALVGGTTYLKVLNVNSPSEYLKLKIQAKDLMPLGTWEKEQAIVDSAANSYVANNNLEADMATYRNAQSDTERIQALNRIASDLGKAWNIDNVTVKIVPPNEEIGNVIAYTPNTLENGFFSSKFSTDYVICIPENSKILSQVMWTGSVVHVFIHEITHMRQVNMMNDQVSGQKSDLGYLLVASSKMYVNPKEVYGLYASQPLEYHSNAAADKFVKNSIDKGVIK